MARFLCCSNFHRFVDPSYVSKRLGMRSEVLRCTQRPSFLSELERKEKDVQLLVVANITSLLLSDFSGSQFREEEIEKVFTEIYEKVSEVRLVLPDIQSFVVPPLNRPLSQSYAQLYPTVIGIFYQVSSKYPSVKTLNLFTATESDYGPDLIHLTEDAGRKYTNKVLDEICEKLISRPPGKTSDHSLTASVSSQQSFPAPQSSEWLNTITVMMDNWAEKMNQSIREGVEPVRRSQEGLAKLSSRTERGHMNDSNTSQVRRRTKRTVVDCDDNVDNVLTRTNVHDQIEIFQRIEHSLDQTGYPGQKCLLRVICELHETPIHDTSIVGEMMTKFFKPRASRNKKLDIYQEAADIGEHGGNCSDHFKACPVSIFNIIPSFAADGEDIQVSFDPVEAGSKTTKGVDSDLEDVYKNPNFFESFQVYPTF